MTSWDQFKQIATQIAAQEGYPLAVLLGQAAHETGFGTSARAKRNQWFGVGAYQDNSPGVQYDSAEASIRGYIDLIKNDPRYAKAWAARSNPTQMLREIANAGYAADEDYFNLVANNREFKQNINQALIVTNEPQMQQPQYNEKLTYQDYTGKTWKFNNQTQKYEQPGITPTPSQQYIPTLNKSITSPVPAKPTKTDIWETIKNLLIPQVFGQETSSSVTTPPNQYTVRPGDTLWGIAQNTLGSGNRWKELQGHTGSPATMPVGARITIPTSSQVPKLAPNTSTRQGAVYTPPPQQSSPKQSNQLHAPSGKYVA